MDNARTLNASLYCERRKNILKTNKTHRIDNFKKNYDSIFRKEVRHWISQPYVENIKGEIGWDCQGSMAPRIAALYFKLTPKHWGGRGGEVSHNFSLQLLLKSIWLAICKNWQGWNAADSTRTSWAILGQFPVLLPIFGWFVNKKEFSVLLLQCNL